MADAETVRDAVHRAHWLVVDEDQRIGGCHCGYVAPVDYDYGDAVLQHVTAVVVAALCDAGKLPEGEPTVQYWREIDPDTFAPASPATATHIRRLWPSQFGPWTPAPSTDETEQTNGD